ncbi:hypothetical protein DV451_004347 [Geotrichum candidum]|uniref:A to I editase domain-containing protein n=1 Tax=Geotrichum candidum TaxID=1173061 RepID=A0A9P5G281_GEOCN|nr:hypothetical protein DV451_004347 [Geotrichum candidum]
MSKRTQAFYDRVASLVISKYSSLPRKGKPIVRTDGTPEWTTLAGIVLETDSSLECVSVATGVKATPDQNLDKLQGRVLHDMHAEILCIRGFNRFLLNECLRLDQHKSKYIRRLEVPVPAKTEPVYPLSLFGPTAGLKIHMYISESPCGDCSLSTTASTYYATAKEIETWQAELERLPNGLVRGRDHFHHVGHVRTKPGRRDSPLSMSKSCSDKLALKQFTSLLSGPVSNIIDSTADDDDDCEASGFFLSSLIVPRSEMVTTDFARAFRGRLADITVPAQYFEFIGTDVEFAHSRKQPSEKGTKPCPYAIVHVANGKSEGTIMGVRQGFKPTSTCKGPSQVSRIEIASTVRHVLDQEGVALPENIEYLKFKDLNQDRRALKQEVYKDLTVWASTKSDDFTFCHEFFFFFFFFFSASVAIVRFDYY